MISVHVSCRSRSGESRDEEEAAKPERGKDDAPAEGGEIVLVSAADLLDHAVSAESLE